MNISPLFTVFANNSLSFIENGNCTFDNVEKNEVIRKFVGCEDPRFAAALTFKFVAKLCYEITCGKTSGLKLISIMAE